MRLKKRSGWVLAVLSGANYSLPAGLCGDWGLWLADVDADQYQPGKVGLFTGTWSWPNIQVGFDDFAIIEP